MGSDNRDWHSQWWRKRTGYVERASFRVSEAERLRMRRYARWRKVFVLLFVFLIAFTVYERFR